MLDRVKHGKTSGRMPGFSLIELIAVIMIIAIISAAIFVGSGTASMKARAAKVTSDLYNYQIAAEKILYNQPQVRNIATGTKKTQLANVVELLNNNLLPEYMLSVVDEAFSGSISLTSNIDDDTTFVVCRSRKLDPWGDPYYVILDSEERTLARSEFFVTAISAGPNFVLNLDGEIDSDDIFLLVSCSNGRVTSSVYDMSEAIPITVDGATATTYTESTSAPINSIPVLDPGKDVPIVTSPEVKTGLVYNGSAQVLVDAGDTTGGTLEYSLDGDTWSVDVPTASDAGTYTVYYRVSGDENFESVDPDSVSVSISRQGIARVTASSVNLIYSGSNQIPTWNNWSADTCSKGGTTTAQGPGVYTTTFTPGTNYQWSSGSDVTSAISITWSVARQEYAVTYNANGGSGAPSAQTKQYGINLALSSTEPLRDGYQFTGWNTVANGSGTSYAAGATYTSNAALSLYAQWKKVAGKALLSAGAQTGYGTNAYIWAVSGGELYRADASSTSYATQYARSLSNITCTATSNVNSSAGCQEWVVDSGKLYLVNTSSTNSCTQYASGLTNITKVVVGHSTYGSSTFVWVVDSGKVYRVNTGSTNSYTQYATGLCNVTDICISDTNNSGGCQVYVIDSGKLYAVNTSSSNSYSQYATGLSNVERVAIGFSSYAWSSSVYIIDSGKLYAVSTSNSNSYTQYATGLSNVTDVCVSDTNDSNGCQVYIIDGGKVYWVNTRSTNSYTQYATSLSDITHLDIASNCFQSFTYQVWVVNDGKLYRVNTSSTNSSTQFATSLSDIR